MKYVLAFLISISTFLCSYAQHLIISTNDDSIFTQKHWSDEHYRYFIEEGSGQERKIPRSLVAKIVPVDDDGNVIPGAGSLSRECKAKLAETRFADLNFSEAMVDMVISNPSNHEAQMYVSLVNYLKEDLNFEQVIVTQDQRAEVLTQLAASICDIAFIDLTLGEFQGVMALGSYDCVLKFAFCDTSIYTIQVRVNVNGYTKYSKKFRKVFQKDVLASLQHVEDDDLLKLKELPLIMNEGEIRKYLMSEERKPYEGIFRLFSSESNTANYKLGIVDDGEGIKVIYLSGSDFEEDWNEGELKGLLEATASSKHFLGKWYDVTKASKDIAIEFEDWDSFSFTRQRASEVDTYIRIQ